MADPVQLKDVLPNPPVAVPEPVKVGEAPMPPPQTVPPAVEPVSTPPVNAAPPAKPPQAAPPPTPTPPQWKIPAGYNLPPETQSAIEAAIKDGAKPEHLQRFIDLHVGSLQSAERARAAQQQQRIEQWTNTVLNDKEFGGARFNEARDAAAMFLKSFGDPDLQQYLSESGAGYHPGMFRAFARAGQFMRQRMSEDSLAGLGTRSGGVTNRPATQQERLEKLYDSPDMQRLRTPRK